MCEQLQNLLGFFLIRYFQKCGIENQTKEYDKTSEVSKKQ